MRISIASATFSVALLFAATAFLLSGCSKDATAEIKRLEHQIAETKTTTDELQATIQRLEKSQKEIKTAVAILDLHAFEQKTVEIHPISRGYGILETRFGTLLVDCGGAEPYLNGYKLKLQVGNPLNVTFQSFTVTCMYGHETPSKSGKQLSDADWDKYFDSQRTNTVKFSDTLKPGRWTNIEVPLAPCTLEQLGHIEMSIELGEVWLYESKN